MSIVHPQSTRLKALELYKTIGSVKGVADKMGLPRTTVNGWILDQRVVKHCKEGAALAKEMNIYSEEVFLQVDDLEKIHLYDVTDEHFGHWGVDYEATQAVYDYIYEDPFGYMTSGGDTHENTPASFKNESTVFDQVVNPAQQKAATLARMRPIIDKERFVAYREGNHEERNARRAQATFAADLNAIGCDVMTNIGFLKIQMGEQEYNGLLAHSLAGSSLVNPFNAHRNSDLKCYSRVLNFIMAAHQHKPGIMTTRVNGKDKVYTTGGTMKVKDPFLQSQLASFDFGVPRLTFYRDHHQIEVKMMYKENFGL